MMSPASLGNWEAGSSRSANGFKGSSSSVDWLGREMLGMRLRDELDRDDDRDSEPDVIDGMGAEVGRVIRSTSGGRSGQSRQTLGYSVEHVVGTGSFGVVFKAKCRETGEIVAIKKVLQDKRYKNRESQIMQTLDHPNIVALKHCFFSATEKEELYLNLVLEFVPETVNRIARNYSRINHRMPLIFVKLYTYHICRALVDIHNCIGICHRDIKPQNLLPLFLGESGVDQLVEIIKVLGTPTREEVKCMNPKYTEFKFPQIKPHPWHKVFQKRLLPEAADFLEACIHPFFDELRDPNTRLPNGRPLPPLFNLKSQELERLPSDIVNRLVPEHACKHNLFTALHN